MTKASVDRIEEDRAVLIIEGQERVVARSRLPEGAREGDVIDLSTGALDAAERDEVEARVKAARERAKSSNESTGGNFDL